MSEAKQNNINFLPFAGFSYACLGSCPTARYILNYKIRTTRIGSNRLEFETNPTYRMDADHRLFFLFCSLNLDSISNFQHFNCLFKSCCFLFGSDVLLFYNFFFFHFYFMFGVVNASRRRQIWTFFPLLRYVFMCMRCAFYSKSFWLNRKKFITASIILMGSNKCHSMQTRSWSHEFFERRNDEKEGIFGIK